MDQGKKLEPDNDDFASGRFTACYFVRKVTGPCGAARELMPA